MLIQELICFVVGVVARNALSEGAERYVQVLDILADRSATIALGDISMDRVSRGYRLRSDPFQFKRERPE